MAWTYLFLAGACEIVATTLFRYTDGFTKIVPTVAFFAIGIFSFYLLNKSLTGIRAAGTALIGIAFYQEPTSAMRIVSLVMLIAGIVGLKLFQA